MLGRSEIFRVAAIVVLITVFIVTLAAINWRSSMPVTVDPSTSTTQTANDLSAELRRCSALGPTDAVDARCEAVWEENRRRFLGRPARPLPPQTPPGTAAPATDAPGDVR